MLTGFIVVIISYVHIRNHVIHLKLIQVYVNYISIKLGKYKITKKIKAQDH